MYHLNSNHSNHSVSLVPSSPLQQATHGIKIENVVVDAYSKSYIHPLFITVTLQYFNPMTKSAYLSLISLFLLSITQSASAQIQNTDPNYQRFYGEITEKGIELIWMPRAEGKRDVFVIEFQTIDDQWETLGKLPSFGRSTRSRKYHFSHRSPLVGQNYYRLSQYDEAGKRVMRENAIVLYKKNNELAPELAVERVKDFANIKSPYQAILTIHSRDQYNVAQLQLEKGNNMIDVSSLEPGDYIFEIEGEEDTFVTRLFVEEGKASNN